MGTQHVVAVILAAGLGVLSLWMLYIAVDDAVWILRNRRHDKWGWVAGWVAIEAVVTALAVFALKAVTQ